MTGPIHTPEALAAFQSGEERMVFARFKNAPPNTPPYFLEDGTARDKALKAWVPPHLECLMPGCPEPHLRAVNRSQHSGRRDGFSHRPGAGKHAPEGLFHQQGKALIQAWVTRAYPEAIVTLETATQHRERIADVMVEWPTGQRIAIEIQYAALTVDAWLTRHQSYITQGVTPVWLLGHHGAHMKVARDPWQADWENDAGQVQLSLLHKKMLEHDAAVLWINPVDRTLATPWTVERVSTQSEPYSIHCKPATSRAFVTVDAVDHCTLDPTRGLITPTIQLIDEAARERHEAEQRRLEEEARRQSEEAAERSRLEQLARQQQETWESSDLAATFTQRWGLRPSLLTRSLNEPADQSAVQAHPDHWRAVIYEELIHAFALGRQPTLEDQILTATLLPQRTQPKFTLQDIRAAFAAHGIELDPERPQQSFDVVLAFLEHLRDWQLIRIRWTRHRQPDYFEPTGQTLAQLEAAYRKHVQDLERQRQMGLAALAAQRKAWEAAKARAEELRKERVARQSDPVVAPEPEDREREAQRSTCTRCQGALPYWQRGGYHTLGCPDPVQARA